MHNKLHFEATVERLRVGLLKPDYSPFNHTPVPLGWPKRACDNLIFWLEGRADKPKARARLALLQEY